MAAIEAVSNKKCKYTAGKPSHFMYQVLSQKYEKIKKEKTCMIGSFLSNYSQQFEIRRQTEYRYCFCSKLQNSIITSVVGSYKIKLFQRRSLYKRG